MKILSIETSCDETAVSIVEAKGGLTEPYFSVISNALFSQIDIHKEYGGVFPTVAKREHSKKLPSLLKQVLQDSGNYINSEKIINENIWTEIKNITSKEDNLYQNLRENLESVEKPDIDIIAVTSGPGLEPALWVGISCAKALGVLWNTPVIPANHMEGHMTSVLINTKEDQNKIQFPALALLISGGHTELVDIQNWGKYKIIGETKDDAVGEAFDKVARMLGLPYPGGPQISKLAQDAREKNLERKCKLPRPMINSNDLNFSFSGLKTAVLYYIRDNPIEEEEDKQDIAREFEDSAIEVLLSKTEKAIQDQNSKTLIIAGGVTANKRLREKFKELENKYSDLSVKMPTNELSTDNSLMIASAVYIESLVNPEVINNRAEIKASGNLKFN